MLESNEYGEFFPARFSPMRFMDSGAVLMFLATETQAKQFGALDYPPESAGACGEDRVAASELQKNDLVPDCIDDPSLDQWIGKPFFDAEVQRRFIFLPQEAALFKLLHVAPAKRHFVSRVWDLAFRANGGSFTSASCANCGQVLRVAENRMFPQRNIYCKPCYLQFIEQNG